MGPIRTPTGEEEEAGADEEGQGWAVMKEMEGMRTARREEEEDRLTGLSEAKEQNTQLNNFHQ